MKRKTLTFNQKRQIILERNRRQSKGERVSQNAMAAWAKETFKLDNVPGKAVMSRIWNDPALNSDSSASNYRMRRRGAKHEELEEALFDWVCDVRNSRKCISGAIIQAKALQLAQKANELLLSDSQITTQFSEGWLENFKRRWQLKSFKLHGEAGDVDEHAINEQLARIRQKVSQYALKDVFNCDESGLFYQMAPDRTIAPSSFAGRKKQKARFTFLAGCNADGTERFPLMFIGNSCKPRCFNKKTGEELGLYYRNNKKAWMNSSLCFEWLKYIDNEIGKQPDRKILLLMDNCSAHGSKETLPSLQHVEVEFLPPNTTSKLQPLDAGIIAAMKVRYRRRQMEHAVDMLDEGVLDVYKIDILTAMRWLSSIWSSISDETIRNCWGTTGIVPAYDTDAAPSTLPVDAEDIASLESFIQIVVPTASRRVTVDELMSWDDEIDSTQVYSDDDMVANIVSAGSEEEDASATVEESEHDIGPLGKQLASLAHVKRICVAHGLDDPHLLAGLRGLQIDIRDARRRTLSQTRIDQFFGSQQ